jgi:hypothetical protein
VSLAKSAGVTGRFTGGAFEQGVFLKGQNLGTEFIEKRKRHCQEEARQAAAWSAAKVLWTDRTTVNSFGFYAVVPFCTLISHARSDLNPLESGGDDGARTRDLCRDSAPL